MRTKLGKVLVSIGGGDGIEGPRFNKMASSESSRQAFVKNVRALITKYGYDGVDIDWEVPNAQDTSDCTKAHAGTTQRAAFAPADFYGGDS